MGVTYQNFLACGAPKHSTKHFSLVHSAAGEKILVVYLFHRRENSLFTLVYWRKCRHFTSHTSAAGEKILNIWPGRTGPKPPLLSPDLVSKGGGGFEHGIELIDWNRMNRFWYLPPEARKFFALLVLIVRFLHQKRAFPKGLLVPIHQKFSPAAGQDKKCSKI